MGQRMYLAYTRNSRFTSHAALPAIHFMRRSLVEALLLAPRELAYRIAFVYVRQLAIFLRNAIQEQSKVSRFLRNFELESSFVLFMCSTTHVLVLKEARQLVCCWQFLHSAHLWADLIGASVRLESLDPATPDSLSTSLSAGGGTASASSQRLSRGRATQNGKTEAQRVRADASTDVAVDAEAEAEVKRLMDDPRVRRNPLRLLIYPLTEVILGSIQYTRLYD